MSQSKYNITIEYSHRGYYKVDLRDYHCNYTQVYEPSVKQALDYAGKWCEQAEEREKNRRIQAKAIKEMHELDKKAGILTGNSDGLD
jgi:hypothetical protein